MNIDSIISAWNKQADEYNQWSSLGEDEKIEFTVKLARKETLEKVISIIPGGSVVDPQVICDEIRELMANDGTNEA